MQVENLTVSYRIKRHWIAAVREFCLQLQPGQVYGLVGESGSGKSTVALALMRYLSSNGRVESGGTLNFAGEDLLAKSNADMRRLWAKRIKFVPQNAGAALNPSIKIGRQVREVLEAAEDIDSKAAHDAMMDMFHQVNLVDPERVAERYPHELSGGMQQRVIIAMAMISNPDLLIMDEPTTGLDVTTEAVILDLVRGLIAERDTGVIYITHNLGVVAQLCERVLVLYAGEIMEEAEVHALFQQPHHPYTRGLISSVPKPGQSKHEARLQSISGNPPALTQQAGGCVFADRCSLVIERCWREKPPLESVTDGRVVRCHRWEEVDQPHPPTPSPKLQGGADIEGGNRSTLMRVSGMTKHFAVAPTVSEALRRVKPTPIRAVDGVDLALRAGQTLGLVGESGSGKTTLARVIIGLEAAQRRQAGAAGAGCAQQRARAQPGCAFAFADGVSESAEFAESLSFGAAGDSPPVGQAARPVAGGCGCRGAGAAGAGEFARRVRRSLSR